MLTELYGFLFVCIDIGSCLQVYTALHMTDLASG